MTKREDSFLAFCSRALGTPADAPLKDINGAMVNGLVEAYRATRPPKKRHTREIQTFDDPLFEQPWTVYVIRNLETTAAYVGCAKFGFRKRYGQGEWWDEHHCAALERDVLSYGLRSFRVSIHVCRDEADMRRVEADLIRANRPYTYNVRAEPDNKVA